MKLSGYLFATFFFILFQIGLTAQTQNIYRIKSPENSLYLEVSNKSTSTSGVKVYLKKYSNNSRQKWVILKGYNNQYTIKNLANGKMMSAYPLDLTRDGNPLILNSPDNSNLQKWRMDKNFSTGHVTIRNIENDKVLVPEKNAYRRLDKIVLNRPSASRKQSWILVPVTGNNNVGGSANFAGTYKNESSRLQMEIRSTGSNSYKAVFSGGCSDESLSGSMNSNGVLVLPLKSNNNARLEIRSEGSYYRVSITNVGQMSSRSVGGCTGGMIEGRYKKQTTGNAAGFTGVFNMTYGNQRMEIVSSGYSDYKVIFTGNCKAETLAGNINRNGELEIPLRGGYNDKLYVRKNGSLMNVRVTNKNLLRNVCNNGSLEGNYTRGTGTGVGNEFAGRYRTSSGRQHIEIQKSGYNGYKAVFTGDCRAETLAGKIDSRGVLVIPLRGGYNDQLEVSKQGNRIKVYVTNKNLMKNACQGYSVEGFYDRQSWNDNGNSSSVNFSGRYQLDMQFVQLIPEGSNRYKARFYGDCELTTKTGIVYNGVLEIPFVGENQVQKMMIRKRGNNIEIKNTSNSAMMGLCRGATLAGFYQKR